MNTDWWKRVEETYHTARELSGEERSRFLDAACMTDTAMRRQIEVLLQQDENADSFLNKPAVESLGTAMVNPPLDQIGNYRLILKVGEGGMGEVYEAEQLEPIQRRVALKLVKWGMNTREVVARFEAERQALALMSHPNIAHIFDGGATAQGRPFFVMEFVSGTPVTEYCNARNLSIRERLELFIHVCEGVQHAHQKGIIHRDIKPSNVLIAIQDGRAVPKIIDFGLAKAMEQGSQGDTLLTQAGMRIGTPAYMSPEQVTGLDLDTRTDVYSLGVLLYELLTGVLPFDSKELLTPGWEALHRRVVEEEPRQPSARSSVEAAKLLRGDLDWITLRALEKDRAGRYGSPSELAADISRHLNHEPVLASPPSRLYRMKKFVRRHRLSVAAATTVLIALLVGTVGTTIGLIRAIRAERAATRAERAATQEAENARQVSDFLVGLFQVSDPSEARGNTITAREILDKGAQQIERELNDQPFVKAQMMHTIGRVYQALGLFKQAQPLLETSVALNRSVAGPAGAQSLMQLAWLYVSQGEYAKALAHYQEALSIIEKNFGPDHVDRARALMGIGVVQRNTGKLAEARASLNGSLAIYEKVLGPEHSDVASVLGHLGWLHNLNAEYAEAVRSYERALAIMEKNLGLDHPDLTWVLNDLAVVNEKRGDFAKAREHHDRALAIREKVFGPNHPQVAQTLDNVGSQLLRMGKYREARSYYERALGIRETALRPDHPDVAVSLNNIALALNYLGDDANRVRPLYERALAIKEKAFGPDHPEVASALANLASMTEPDKARSLLERALAIQEKSLGPEHADLVFTLLSLANLYHTERKYALARPLYERALAIQEKTAGPDHPEVARVLRMLGELYADEGQNGQARPLLERALAIQEKALGPDHHLVALTLGSLAYVSRDRYEQARSLYERSVAILTKNGIEDKRMAIRLLNLADLHFENGNYQQARPVYERGLEIKEKVFGRSHIDVAYILQQLADIHQRNNNHRQAQLLFERALPIVEKTHGRESTDAAASLTRLALSYAAQGDRIKTDSLLERAAAIQKSVRKENDPWLPYNLARLSAIRGDHDSAMQLLRRAVELGLAETSISDDPVLASLRGNPEFETIAGVVKQRKARR